MSDDDSPVEEAGFGTEPGPAGAADKYYEIYVPDYLATQTDALNSYHRLGAFTLNSAERPEDAAILNNFENVEVNDGGIRSHTDGSRVETTSGDKYEYIHGSYRLLAAGDQESSSSDPDWNNPKKTDTEHVYSAQYYEVTATTWLPGTTDAEKTTVPTYAEPRVGLGQISLGRAYDLYEYSAANNLYEVTVGRQSIVDKMYGGRLLEILSTVYGDHASWELDGNYDGTHSGVRDCSTLNDGDLVEYMFAKNLTEIMRAEDLIVDKIYGDRILEVISTTNINDFEDWETNPQNLSSGDLREYINGKNIVEVMRAEDSLTETLCAGGDLSEATKAGGEISEVTTAGHSISEVTTAGKAILEVTAAGGAVSSLTCAGGVVLEALAAAGGTVEIFAGEYAIAVTLSPNIYELLLTERHEVSLIKNMEASKEKAALVDDELKVGAKGIDMTALRTTMSNICMSMAEIMCFY